MDYYNVLGIPIDATPEEVRSAYFDAARRLHPDANPGPGARDQFLAIQQAYEVLRNDRRRAEYDASLPLHNRERAKVLLTAKHSRSVIPLLDEAQLFYVLLNIACTAELDTTRIPPVSVCMVLDKSTSMSGQRMDMVKSNILQMVGTLRPHDIFSLVAFSDRADVVIPPSRISAMGRIETTVHALQTGGATEIFRGLQAGVDLLRRTSDAKMSRHLIFMTDGHTYGDEENALELAQRAADEGITISAFGIGNEWNDVFLDKLVLPSGGVCNYVTSTADLSNFAVQRLKTFEVLYARNLILEYESDPGIELRGAYRISPDIAELPLSGAIPLGNLQFGKSIEVLMEFHLPPFEQDVEETTLMRGKIRMDVPSLQVVNSRLLFDFKKQVKISLGRENPPTQIVEAMSRLSLYRLQDKARLEVAEGKVLDAAKHLHYLATHLLAKGDRELAHTVLLEAENVKQNNRYSEEGDKRIKYGTRSLLMLPAPEQKP